ncbi:MULTISPECIES: heme ABC exporter ATP-binding protein CcmA [Alphaproteobacteria]|uniref:Cytochrome c biogenesis ATP-binding export protein CcmA n=2 Tax=Alphaproteobacteria TaxID=28211 RepID=A0A512HKB6_9HYPH|nr:MULTISPECIES: heme ABC exporter ATP-binding protein CcmA [Alphaproteobacteria]GEO85883.1 cytochrome c biogenesis ATP-binding export protein CcmA [Ciceribacter naphthalenivorans]GLR21739.1 cytochrome c biogenesis ATP-binding export protein CcmA [Ciceribacter naphthalenivorans]GLT04595.1 cytochrome c biogenesis ATP-binding export protein CcmA [Sphingomonas psychrolutea]
MRLIAEDLAARRGEDLIFSGVSFTLAAGEALVLIGRNGSGKSTLLRVVAGLLRPEAGRVEAVFGDGRESRPAREVSHYLGHRNAMKQELTVVENLTFWRDFLGDVQGGVSLSIDEAAETVGLGGITHLPFGYLSAGQQRRFAMAKLLVAHRPVWILDEPTAALDASADQMFAGLVHTHLSKGGIVIAATHQPLGLNDAKTLVMKGFEYREMEEMA